MTDKPTNKCKHTSFELIKHKENVNKTLYCLLCPDGTWSNPSRAIEILYPGYIAKERQEEREYVINIVLKTMNEEFKKL